MKNLCTICARGGSKGVPGKNIRPLCGKPLILHTLELARSLPFIDHILISTDSEEIARVCREAGVEVPFLRPAELSTDGASKLGAIHHALDHLENLGHHPELIIDLDPTSPLRLAEDVEGCYKLIQREDTDAVITGYRSNKNPYFNMVEINGEGYARLSKPPGEKAVLSRQTAPVVYAMNASIYIWKTSWFRRSDKVINGRVKIYEMPEERSVDIDSPTDFEFVEFMMRKR